MFSLKLKSSRSYKMGVPVMWLSFLLMSCSSYALNWCDSKYECLIDGKTKEHIMCASLPGRAICTALTRKPASEMLQLHNEVRKKIATEEWAEEVRLPKACPMSDIVWDDQLASGAERLGISCMIHDSYCRGTDEFKEVGQNTETLRMDSTAVYKPIIIMQNMFSKWLKSLLEVRRAEDIVAKYYTGSWSQGTQILWSKTSKMGCSMLKYHKVQENETYHALICNYGPAGNIPGEEVYSTDCSSPKPLTITDSSQPSTTAITASTTYGPAGKNPGEEVYSTDSSTPTPLTIDDSSQPPTAVATTTAITANTTISTSTAITDSTEQTQGPARASTTASTASTNIPLLRPTNIPAVKVLSSGMITPDTFSLVRWVSISLILNHCILH